MGGSRISETNEVTTVVKAAAMLFVVRFKGERREGEGRGGERETYIKPTATSRTLSWRAKSEKPALEIISYF